MSQHDMDAANQAGVSYRADMNNALLALVSNNSGATEPATKYAYMWWPDTTTGIMKQRNAANTAWLNKFQLADGELLTIAAAQAGYAALAGSASVFSVGTPAAATHAMNNSQFRDGWINDFDTWECTTAGVAGSLNANGSINVAPVSAIFRIVGVDRTATFVKGLKVKYTQTTVKYGYVLSSVLSGSDTIVTMTPNASYIMGLSSGTAITSPAFSFEDSPSGFPDSMAFVGAVTAVAGAFTNITASLVYSMKGTRTILNASVLYTDIGTATTGTRVPLPTNASSSGFYPGVGNETAAVGHMLLCYASATTSAIVQKYDGTASLVNGYKNCIYLDYR